MTGRPIISRRLLLAGLWLAGLPSVWPKAGRAGSDQGIRGTGITRGNDNGVSGTGIVWVIRRFGSIFGNGERISCLRAVVVRVDGKPASVGALRAGEAAGVLVVRRVICTLTAGVIDSASVAVGRVEAFNGD